MGHFIKDHLKPEEKITLCGITPDFKIISKIKHLPRVLCFICLDKIKNDTLLNERYNFFKEHKEVLESEKDITHFGFTYNSPLCNVEKASQITNKAFKLDKVNCEQCLFELNNNKEVIDKLNANSLSKTAKKIANSSIVGKVLTHCDGMNNHLCIVIDENEEDAFILMLTSNPHWNKHSRKLTDSEKSYFTLQLKKDTYFAPEIRSKKDLSFTEITYIPLYKVEELKQEFYHLPA